MPFTFNGKIKFFSKFKEDFKEDLNKFNNKETKSTSYWKINKSFPTIDGFSLGNPNATCEDSKISICFQITISSSHSSNVTENSTLLLKTMKTFCLGKKCKLIYAVPKSRFEIKFFIATVNDTI